jgi:hypothetical protein
MGMCPKQPGQISRPSQDTGLMTKGRFFLYHRSQYDDKTVHLRYLERQ